MRQTVEKLKTAVELTRKRLDGICDQVGQLSDQIDELMELIDEAVIDSTLPSPAVEVVTDVNGKKRLEYHG
jgi:hypothetical protein